MKIIFSVEGRREGEHFSRPTLTINLYSLIVHSMIIEIEEEEMRCTKKKSDNIYFKYLFIVTKKKINYDTKLLLDRSIVTSKRIIFKTNRLM